MKEITLKIPEDKFDFYMELFRQLGLESESNFEIPKEHKDIVRERIRLSEENKSNLLNWEAVKDEFDF
ncbi:addiction module protein [Belliella marina]|uniref:Addiction module protein n=1 Tax=Belliella marina TaxID=1644146 RepID=A0ABW4VNT7_9BACT